jgi:hypothetical protein
MRLTAWSVRHCSGLVNDAESVDGGLAQPLRSACGVTLERHTQVENLANLLAVRRRQTIARDRRDQAYRQLAATILKVPVDGLALPRLPMVVGGPATPLPMRRVRAA